MPTHDPNVSCSWFPLVFCFLCLALSPSPAGSVENNVKIIFRSSYCSALSESTAHIAVHVSTHCTQTQGWKNSHLLHFISCRGCVEVTLSVGFAAPWTEFWNYHSPNRCCHRWTARRGGVHHGLAQGCWEEGPHCQLHVLRYIWKTWMKQWIWVWPVNSVSVRWSDRPGQITQLLISKWKSFIVSSTFVNSCSGFFFFFHFF